MTNTYLYRHDRLESLLSQRLSDPVLRGRQSNGSEAFGHSQIIEAHAQIQTQNEAVYTLSFWRTFDDLKRNRFGIEKGAVIQRIREDHPILQSYKRGDDEFLPEEAWLYWATFPVPDGKPERAPIGIPHTDIEVLHPAGQWVPMNEVAVLANKIGMSWKSVAIHSGVESRRIYWQYHTNLDGSQIVLLRQPYGFYGTSYQYEQELASIIRVIVNEGGLALEDFSGIRWFYVWESRKEVLGEEVFIKIEKNFIRGLRGIIERWRDIEPDEKWVIFTNQPTRTCGQTEIEMLYQTFGLTEMLCRGDRWLNAILQKN